MAAPPLRDRSLTCAGGVAIACRSARTIAAIGVWASSLPAASPAARRGALAQRSTCGARLPWPLRRERIDPFAHTWRRFVRRPPAPASPQRTSAVSPPGLPHRLARARAHADGRRVLAGRQRGQTWCARCIDVADVDRQLARLRAKPASPIRRWRPGRVPEAQRATADRLTVLSPRPRASCGCSPPASRLPPARSNCRPRPARRPGLSAGLGTDVDDLVAEMESLRRP
jgi:hypothetical protein